MAKRHEMRHVKDAIIQEPGVQCENRGAEKEYKQLTVR
jgi:hypothetical protein